MGDASLLAKRDVPVSISSLSRGAEKQQLDLGGLRLGKQRLVGKKKKKSALKKLILEEREDKLQQAGKTGTQPSLSAPNGGRENASSWCLDAPEFTPAFWPSAGEAETPAADGPANKVVNNKGTSQATTSLSTSAPDFVPSWCRAAAVTDAAAPQDDAIGESKGEAEDEGDELPVSEAMERLRALKEQPAPKEKKPPGSGDNIEVRHYVHQVLSTQLDDKVKEMLGELNRFQERAKEKEAKYQKLKRLCFGMREAQRAVGRGKAKCLVMAPNLEECSLEGGLDDQVEDLIETCTEREVPVVFALSRNRIGKALGKSIRLSIVCVLSKEGADQQFKEIIKMTDELRRQWVLKQMSHRSQMTDEQAEEEMRLADERAAARTARREAKLKEEEDKRNEEERQRLEAKAAKEAAKAERQAARERAAEEKRRKRAEQTAKEAKENQLTPEEEKAAEEERLRQQREAERQREQARREAERKAEEERRKLQELLKKRAEEAKAQEAEEESSDEDLPLGFNSTLF